MCHRVTGVASLCAAAVLAACGSSQSSGTPSAGPSVILSTHFASLPDGSATISFDRSTQRLSLRISAHGFAPGRAHAVHIHAGSCLARSERVVAAFPDAASDSSGMLALDAAALQRTPSGVPKGAYLDIHLVDSSALATATPVDALPITCSDLAAGTAVSSVRLFPTPGHKPFGTATATWNGSARSLAVQLNLAALDAVSAHAVDIRAGACKDGPGQLKYPAPKIDADAAGAVDASVTVSGVEARPLSSGWFITIYLGTTTQPLLCGDLSAT